MLKMKCQNSFEVLQPAAALSSKSFLRGSKLFPAILDKLRFALVVVKEVGYEVYICVYRKISSHKY